MLTWSNITLSTYNPHHYLLVLTDGKQPKFPMNRRPNTVILLKFNTCKSDCEGVLVVSL